MTTTARELPPEPTEAEMTDLITFLSDLCADIEKAAQALATTQTTGVAA